MKNTTNDTRRIWLEDTLKSIISDKPGTIDEFVATQALHYDEDVSLFFYDLFHHGCISGTIPALIYYADTHTFYDQYYYEIEYLRLEYEDSIGEPIRIRGDLKNYLTWFAVEETAYQMASKLGLLM